MTDPTGAHPGRPSGPPPAGSPTPPPGGPPGGVPPTTGGPQVTSSGPDGPSRTPLVIAAVAVGVAVVLIASAVAVFVISSDEAAAEVFLEAATEPGPDPFFTDARADAVASPETTSTTTPPTTDTPSATRSVSGGAPGLYGGTQNQSVCDPEEQAAFLADNPSLARAFTDALNADPTFRWSGGDRVSPEEISAYLRELTPVTLTADTRVTNHGFRDGRPTPRQAVLQRGTAVLVDAYGVPRVKCACGNPLTRPTPLPGRPTYVGPRWDGFTPTTVVVITEVTVQIDVFVLIDVTTGDGFTRPAATTGGEDTPVGTPEPRPEPPTTTPPTQPAPQPTPAPVPPGPAGDLAAFCDQLAYYDALWWDTDVTLGEVAAGFRDLESKAPPEIIDAVNVMAVFLEQQAAAGAIEVDIDEYPEYVAVFIDVLAYANANCGMDFELDF